MRSRALLIIVPLALILLLFATRPSDVRVLIPGASASRSPAPSATTDLSAVPSECRSDVKGAVFASGSLDDRIRAANAWDAGHRGDTASIVVTDDVMKQMANSQQYSVPVENIGITIEPAGFRFNGTISMFGRYPITALLVPTASAGKLRITTQQLDTDGLPGFFRGSVEDALASATDTSKWGLNSRVDGVVTRKGCAVVWGAA